MPIQISAVIVINSTSRREPNSAKKSPSPKAIIIALRKSHPAFLLRFRLIGFHLPVSITTLTFPSLALVYAPIINCVTS